MGGFITLKAEDGHELAAYEATPDGARQGGLVLIQEIFGVNDHIRRVVDGWAGLGYHVVAPALFDRVERGVDVGYDEAGFDKGRAIRGGLADDDTIRDVKAAADHLGAPGTAGIIGFCFGGYVTYLSACRLDFAAAAGYYGGRIVERVDETPNARRCSISARRTRRSRCRTSTPSAPPTPACRSMSIPPATDSAATNGRTTTRSPASSPTSARSSCSAST